eukprot:tig00001093_g6883.t1
MQDSWLVELRREPSRLRGAGFASPAPLAFERAQRAQAGCAHQQSRRGAPHPAIRSLRRPTKSRISWSCSISSAPLPSFVATGRHWLAARREEALVVSAIGQYGGPAAPNVQQDDEDGIALEDEDEQIDDSEGVPRGTQWVAARASGDRTLERIMETGKRGDVAGIIQAVEEHRGFLTDVHISAAMHVLGKFVQPHQRSRTPLMEKGLDFLADKFIHFTSTFRYRQLATFIYGCALAGYQNRAVLDLAAARAIASIHLFPPQNVSMLMWGCAKLNYRNAELLRAVASEVRTRVAKDFTPQGLANTAFGFSKLRHADAEMWQALAARTIEMSKQLNGQELSMLAFAFSAMQMRDETLFEAIAVAGRKMLHDSLTGFQMAVLSRAFGELGLRNEPLFATMASLAPARIGELSSDGLAQLARGYGLVGIRPRNLFKLISDRALEVLPHATPEEICHLAQAFSQVHVKDEALYRAITETVVGRQLQGFTARQVADLAMSFGRAAIPDRRLFRAIASWTIDNISRLSEDDIATIIRGFSATSVRDDALLRAVAENCLGERGFDRFQADTLADLLWAFANAGVRDESIFRAAAASMMPKVPQLSISGLCDTFTAFASMTAGLHTDEEAWALALYAALTEQLLTPGPRGTLRVEQLTHRQAATLVSSCRQAMYDDPRLLQALLRFALRTVRDLQASYLAQFVLAFASLQIDCAALLAHIPQASSHSVSQTLQNLSQAPQGIKFFRSMHDFSNLVYGLVSVGRTDLLQYVIPNLEDTSRRFGGMTQEECSQLNLVFLAIRTEAPELLSLVPDQLRGRIEREHRHKLRSLEHMPRPSALHRAVSWILHNEMGAAFEEEYLVAGAYHVDIAFPEERIALEVDGPAHHLKVSQRFDGSTVLKQRLLRNLGWKVVHVSYVEWLRLESNEEKRVHLEGILRPVLYEDESARPTEEAYRAKPSQIRARSTHRPSELRSCPFCGNLFHQRGLGAHQRWCKVRSSRSDDTTTTSMS